MTRPVQTLGKGLKRFARDKRGVSAIEFAIVAPLLILILFGLNELAQAMMAKRKISHAASSIGDLAAQTQSLLPADIDQIFAAGTATVVPFDTSKLKLRLTSITADAKNKPQIDWSRGKGMDKMSAAPTDLPSGLVAIKGDSIVIAEASYKYDSPIQFNLGGFKPITDLQLNEKFYLRPRQNKVTCATCPP